MRKTLLAVSCHLLAVSTLLIPSLVMADFSDVANSHANFQAINYVQENGVVKGYDDGTYKPDNTINRAEFTKILVEAQFDETTIEACTTSAFSDVPLNTWFTNYICVAEQNEIVAGYPDGTYRPDQMVSFAEAAKIIVNAMKYSVGTDTVWYKPFVEKLGEQKAIPDSIRYFEHEVTRGEMAEMIWRLKASITTQPSKTFATLKNKPEPLPPARPIQISDGVKHSVPLGDIVHGGPAKDGIPSIDNPLFVSIKEAEDFIDEEGLGIAVSFNGVNRFYPNQILVWHEIVNDQIGDQALIVTYCPLCGTGIVYEPLVNNKVSEFGTSGKLWNSNLVMYDRQTDSYWSQVLGESIKGEMTGATLEMLPYQNMVYKEWKKKFPKGQVLSKKTGFIRDYSRDPYGEYYSGREVYFPVDNESDALHPKEVIFGIEIDGRFKAYPLSELNKAKDEFTDSFGEYDLEIMFDEDNQTISITRDDGEEVIPTYGFWFSWYAVHPETEIFKSK